MRELKMEQLTEYSPLNQLSDIRVPMAVDPEDGQFTLLDVTEPGIEITNLNDANLFLNLMGRVAVNFYKHHGWVAYPTFRMEYDPRKS